MITCPHCGRDFKHAWQPTKKWLREHADVFHWYFKVFGNARNHRQPVRIGTEELCGWRRYIAERTALDLPAVNRVEGLFKTSGALIGNGRSGPATVYTVHAPALNAIRAMLHAATKGRAA